MGDVPCNCCIPGLTVDLAHVEIDSIVCKLDARSARSVATSFITPRNMAVLLTSVACDFCSADMFGASLSRIAMSAGRYELHVESRRAEKGMNFSAWRAAQDSV